MRWRTTASGDVLGTIAWSAAEAKAAVGVGQAAFKGWSMTLAGGRAAAFSRMAAITCGNLEPLASMLTLGQDKPLAEACGEVLLGANYEQRLSMQTTGSPRPASPGGDASSACPSPAQRAGSLPTLASSAAIESASLARRVSRSTAPHRTGASLH